MKGHVNFIFHIIKILHFDNSHYAAYTHIYLVACSSMRVLLHAYLVGLGAIDVFFV